MLVALCKSQDPLLQSIEHLASQDSKRLELEGRPQTTRKARSGAAAIAFRADLGVRAIVASQRRPGATIPSYPSADSGVQPA